MRRWWTRDPIAGGGQAGNHGAWLGTTPSLRVAFLARLGRLIDLRSSPRLTAGERRWVDHALYTTYWDCVAVGSRSEALNALGIAQMEGRAPSSSVT